MKKFLAIWNQASVIAGVVARIAYRVVEGGLVLGLFVIACYAGYWLVFGDVQDPRYARMTALLSLASANWQAVLLLLIPLFYRTVRTFAEEVQEFAGAKRRSSLPGPGSEAQNPANLPTQ
ncbi:MAG: hypothetical protein HY944_07825 [Gemmatimonadetes bacterium]|nr:hypothetical protein [Gemmatimonadota bacterium]